MSKPFILFVDDEPLLLEGIKRHLQADYTLLLANGAEQALTFCKENPVEVVVSDYRMPGMNGIELLKKIKEQWPNTVRVILSGNADLNIAMEAINDGAIFRLISKPIPVKNLRKIVESALEQYRLVTAEKDLLENTLMGAIQALMEILSITNPLAFSRAKRLHHYTQEILKSFPEKNRWKYEIASLLSQIGYVTVPTEILVKIEQNRALTAVEQRMVDDSARIGMLIIRKIPRLEDIATMIEHQGTSSQAVSDSVIALGVDILNVVRNFDRYASNGLTAINILNIMKQKGQINKTLLGMLENVSIADMKKPAIKVRIEDVTDDMVLKEDLFSKKKLLLATKGQTINEAMKLMLLNYSSRGDIDSHLNVILP